jgi:hypothetical protein
MGKGNKVPLAGIPYHAGFLPAKLKSRGYKVAICEQKAAGDGKGMMEREVVAAGDAGHGGWKPTLLDARKNNYLVAVVPGEKECGAGARGHHDERVCGDAACPRPGCNGTGAPGSPEIIVPEEAQVEGLGAGIPRLPRGPVPVRSGNSYAPPAGTI